MRRLADTARVHPDCSAARLSATLGELLQEVAEADGTVTSEERKVMVKVKRLLEAPDPNRWNTPQWLERLGWRTKA